MKQWQHSVTTVQTYGEDAFVSCKDVSETEDELKIILIILYNLVSQSLFFSRAQRKHDQSLGRKAYQHKGWRR